MDPLDLIDRKIVAELMRDATLPVAQISEKVGLSQTPCWKRIQRLQETGVLTCRVALADPDRLGFGLTVFVGVEAVDHSAGWRDASPLLSRPSPRSWRSTAWPERWIICCVWPCPTWRRSTVSTSA